MGWSLPEDGMPGVLYYRKAKGQPWIVYTQLPPALRRPDHAIGNKGFATMQHLLRLGVKYAPREEWPQ